MTLTFLGTGAADWKEADWQTPECRRFLTTALLNADALIDCGPTLHISAEAAGISLDGVRYLFCTHMHRDHFTLETLKRLVAAHPITLCAEAGFAANLPSIEGLTVLSLSIGREVEVGPYRVIAMAASHVVTGTKVPTQPIHYIIKHQNSTMFWGVMVVGYLVQVGILPKPMPMIWWYMMVHLEQACMNICLNTTICA